MHCLPDDCHLNLQQEEMRPTFGNYHERPTRCAAGLICTGDLIPTVPATCVLERVVGGGAPQTSTTTKPDTPKKPEKGHNNHNKKADAPAVVEVTKELLLDYGQRWLRMGARTAFSRRVGAGLADQQSQGVPREDVHAAVNVSESEVNLGTSERRKKQRNSRGKSTDSSKSSPDMSTFQAICLVCLTNYLSVLSVCLSVRLSVCLVCLRLYDFPPAWPTTPDMMVARGRSLARPLSLWQTIFETLWPANAVGGPFPGPMELANEGPGAPLCCQWGNYTEQLSDFQAERQGASWRNPMHPANPETGNPPVGKCRWVGG